MTKTVNDDHAVSIAQSATHHRVFVTARSMDKYAEEKRTEKNLIVRSGISEAETTLLIIKDCARRFVLKLYRHEASRGIATAELLVQYDSHQAKDGFYLSYLINRINIEWH